MKRISYSQYSQWDICPYRWKLMYIDKLGTWSDNIHTLFGTSMHEVLQTYLTIMYNDTAKMADALPLDEMLLTRMKKNFVEIMKRNGGEVFVEQAEMEEFYQHGLAILDWFKKKRNNYFMKKGYELVGIEVPIDIKTSTMGWNKYQKADKNKTDQLLLYKHFYSLQNDIPLDKIDVEYFIVKRKLWEKADFPQKRVQKFVPANGKPSLNKVMSKVNRFISESFIDDQHNLEHTYIKQPSKKNCKYCEFANTEHCDAEI